MKKYCCFLEYRYKNSIKILKHLFNKKKTKFIPPTHSHTHSLIITQLCTGTFKSPKDLDVIMYLCLAFDKQKMKKKNNKSPKKEGNHVTNKKPNKNLRKNRKEKPKIKKKQITFCALF